MKYFRQATASNHDQYTYRYISYIFRDRNELDSAKFYAEKYLPIERIDKPNIGDVECATLLFELYKNENPAKALQYHVLAAELRDSLFNQDKAREIDRLVFEEKEHEAETQRRLESAQLAY